MIHRASITSLAALVFLGALCAPAAPATFPGANGKIAFTQSGNEIKVVNPDGSGEATLRHGSSPDWSPDGAAIAFANGGIWRMPADGSSQTLVQPDSDTFDGPWFSDPSWAPDGSRIAVSMTMSFQGTLEEAIQSVKSDGSGWGEFGEGFATRPSWSPGGDSIAFLEPYPDFYLFRVRSDGTGRTMLHGDSVFDLDWSPDGTRIVFSTRGPSADVYVIPSAGGTPTPLTSDPAIDQGPAWSPDGSQIVFSSNRDGDHEIYRMKVDGSNVVQVTHNTVSDTEPDWQPVTGGYARPKGANPLRVSLVPAYDACTTPNREHGPPLAFASCNPPARTSSSITVGTPDDPLHAAAANFVGSVRYGVLVGQPGPPDDSDVSISASLVDVRCSAFAPGVSPCGTSNNTGNGRPDYVGELELHFSIRITDKFNGTAPGGGNDAATVGDTELVAPFACNNTASEATGGSCVLTTSANALVPGLAKDSKRAIWQVDRTQVFDGGPDGDVDTGGNSLFATQGIFVP